LPELVSDHGCSRKLEGGVSQRPFERPVEARCGRNTIGRCELVDDHEQPTGFKGSPDSPEQRYSVDVDIALERHVESGRELIPEKVSGVICNPVCQGNLGRDLAPGSANIGDIDDGGPEPRISTQKGQ
jgi:hypothetical protein